MAQETDEMQRRKSRTGALLLLLIILIAMGIFAELQTGLFSEAVAKTQKRLVPEGIEYRYGSDNSAIFSEGSDGFLCVTRDGATYYDFKGNSIWSQTFTMAAPYIIKSGEQWAILEPLGRNVYVCNAKGVLYTVPSEYPILSASLNELPCLVLILSVNDSYRIQVFNTEGQLSLERKTENEGVYPIHADLSDDGSRIAVSYLDTSKATLQSKLLFFYTKEGAAKTGMDTESPFSAIEKKNSLIAAVRFINNNTLVAVSDREVIMASAKGEEKYVHALQNILLDYALGDQFFAIVNGDSLPSAPGDIPSGTAEWFDYSGKKLGQFPPRPSGNEPEDAQQEQILIEQVEIHGNLLMLKSYDTYYLVDKGGRLLWQLDATADMLRVIPLSKTRAIVAKLDAAEIYTYKTPTMSEAQDEAPPEDWQEADEEEAEQTQSDAPENEQAQPDETEPSGVDIKVKEVQRADAPEENDTQQEE